MKTLLILGNNIGGVGTSTAAAHITGALRLLGHTVQLIDGDLVNRTVRNFEPSAKVIDAKDPNDLSNASRA